jgi:transposase InsO family protein
MPAVIEAWVVALRRAHPGWGPDRIRWQLGRDGVESVPGRSSVYRALVRHGLVEAKRRRRRREEYRRWERARSMELWQMDVMGRLHLVDGRECKIVTGIDDHSRFVVCAKVVGRATARPVCAALVDALRRHGVPGDGAAGVRGFGRRVASARRAGADPHRQRDPASADGAVLADDDGEDPTAA